MWYDGGLKYKLGVRASTMEKAGLTLSRLPYDDSCWRLLLRASNSEFAGVLEFYTDAATVSEFGKRLIDFPRHALDEVKLELGDQSEQSAYYLLLRAFTHDRAFHTALELTVDNFEKNHRRGETSFFIACEAASLNQLGRQICAWLERSGDPLVWVACSR